MDPALEREKQAAAEAAALLVEDGMRVGLGTGSTVAYLLPAVARRGLSLRCVATSVETQEAAGELGLSVEPFVAIERLDIAVDGADQVAPDGWLIKGGGGAHVREKIVAAAADRFVVIGDSSKTVDVLAPPLPVELLGFGLDATLHALDPCTVREGWPPSPDGGVIADYAGPVADPAAVAARIESVAGVVGHGLFPPGLVADVLIARGTEVEHRRIG